MREKEDKAGKRAARSGLSWMTSTATTAKATRSHATARSLRKSHPSSGVIFSNATIGNRATPSGTCLVRILTLVRMPHQHQSGFETVIHFKLIEDIGEVSFNGLLADKYFFSNLLIRQTLGDQA